MPEAELEQLQNKLDEIRRADGRYSRKAYEFVLELVDFTQEQLQRRGLPAQAQHVTPAELLAHVQPLAIHSFSVGSELVFQRWGMRTRADLGAVLQSLVDHDLLSRKPEDSWECFQSTAQLIDLRNHTMTLGWR